ncbi:NAD(P)-binding protein [Sparassis crispa]|uniref:NAD(P)-binding protein n=1 Tax=Sparassis crispa TaxID=139825 RepID=A0A401GN78_9APHY|nr:NAD(P)-binding protein [Sparassis crispa]GBE83630.1 NAD(P)-binding protein [Sparassis crispa]
MKKVILVIGATGAQGLAVIDKLLEPSADGLPSPYTIRALTRDPQSKRSLELAQKGVEIVKGSFYDFPTVKTALEGAYGAWVNTDGFTVGEAKEIFAGIRIFELAKQSKTMRHYVWSSLDYSLKKGGYDQKYRCEHYDGKARVAEWMKAQPSVVSDDAMSWTVVTTPTFGPLNRRVDGTFVFATPVGTGHVPMIALPDLGFFARYTFDNRALTSTAELEVASDMVDWEYLLATFKKVTGQQAVVVYLNYDQWLTYLTNSNAPLANEQKVLEEGQTSWGENFSAWWSLFRDDVIKRDMQWIRNLNPNTKTLEAWMREKGYKGEYAYLLKNTEEGKGISLNRERTSQL